jgi:hypothetical protein
MPVHDSNRTFLSIQKLIVFGASPVQPAFVSASSFSRGITSLSNDQARREPGPDLRNRVHSIPNWGVRIWLRPSFIE